MQRFISKLIWFSLPALLLMGVMTVYTLVQSARVDQVFAQYAQSESLLMGDSQMQRFNGDKLQIKSLNIASSGEPFYFTYQKLKRILDKPDCQVKQVMLNVSFHSFGPVYSRLVNLQFPEGERSFKRYRYFFSLFEESEFTNSGRWPVAPLVQGAFAEPDWGGFYESEYEEPTQEVIDRIFHMHFSVHRNEDRFGATQRDYLYRLDSLCTARQVDLILLSSPYHPDYQAQLSSEHLAYFWETLRQLDHRLHIQFLDEPALPALMSDANHLNKQGVIHYTALINEQLKGRSVHTPE